MPIDVLLIDDHSVVRVGVRHLLEVQPGFRVIGTFGEGRAAVSFARNHKFDVAVVDVAMSGLNGIEVARQIRAARPDSHVLMLTMHANPEYVFQAFEAGARGYVLKEAAGSEVLQAIRAVHGGRQYVSRKLAGSALDFYLIERSRRGNSLAQLSPRERQVLQLVAEGRTSAEVGQTLGLSPKSVETYRSRLMKKLDIGDLPALVKYAIRHGLTSLE